MSVTCYIGLGSNLGDRIGYLRRAVELLDATDGIDVERTSSVYETDPVGPPQPDFLNAVAEIITTLPPHGLLARLKEIEAEIGRSPAERWGPREIDLDLLLFGDHEIDDADLRVPHARMTERAFVLVPLAEIAPRVRVPELGTVTELLTSVDSSGVRHVPSRTTKTLAAFGGAGQVVFAVACIAAGLAERGYSFVSNYISDIGSLASRHAGPYNAAVSLSGIATIALAVALLRVVPASRPGRVGSGFLALAGAGMFVDGLAREDCWAGTSAACRAAINAGHVSLHNRVHDIESIVTLLSFIAAPLFAAYAFRAARRRHLYVASVLSAGVQATALIVLAALFVRESSGQGVPEIVEVAAWVGWQVVMAVGVVRLR